MSMMVFIQPDCPCRFASSGPASHQGTQRRGIGEGLPTCPVLDFDSRVCATSVRPRQPLSYIFFSLNLSIYNQQVVASEWTEQWFFMNGHIHPYVLTCEIEQRDGLESDTGAITQYIIPALYHP
ncbi:hypothetical protein EDB81DRAFT_834611 [Dactylonectria macrodidyma]|uniref:Uncharacterized protein n=1 Tax=Dactylonectria macrodidyma TaxID=307937 RepID=A0A9P9CYA9_9HYPO|nr:hypothetical protein EDB81DRAFT_834611 [Dactylonectria macrodidyma]